MPGFRELEEDEHEWDGDEGEEAIGEGLAADSEESVRKAKPPSSKTKPKAPASLTSTSLPSPSKSRPCSPSKSAGAGGEDSVATHTCPVCTKTMETDNRGLNAHIDFCLSKGAIGELASGSGSGSGGRSGWGSLKPAAKAPVKTKQARSTKRAGKRK